MALRWSAVLPYGPVRFGSERGRRLPGREQPGGYPPEKRFLIYWALQHHDPRVRAGCFGSSQVQFAAKTALNFFNEYFDFPYPFPKYDHVFVPEYNHGAMENPGAVTFNDDRYIFRGPVNPTMMRRRTSTLMHEMAHMWFGDLVTMQWWDDLWLNESFATYMAAGH